MLPEWGGKQIRPNVSPTPPTDDYKLSKVKAILNHGHPPDKLRDLHFDVLIALTARSHGARLITSNRADFEAIRRYCKFQLEVW